MWHTHLQEFRKSIEEERLVYAVGDAAKNFAGEDDPIQAAIASLAATR